MSKGNSDSILVKVALLLISTLTVMAGTTIAPALPAMLVHFASVPNGEYWVKLVLTMPALFIVIGAPIAGLIVDRFGRKPLLIFTVFLYGMAGSSGFFLDSLTYILIGRAFLGLAVGGIMTIATTLIADYYQGQARTAFMGWQAGFMSFGGVIFLSLGGRVADISWRFPFLIYLSAWIFLPLVIFCLFEPERSKFIETKLDAKSEIGFKTNLEPSSKNTFTPPTPVKLLIVIYGLMVLMQAVFYLVPVQLPFYLKELVQAGGSQSGLAIALGSLASTIASIFYGKLKARLDFVSIIPLGFGAMGLGYVLIGFAGSYFQVLVGLVITGIGLGWLIPNLTVWLSVAAPDHLRGRLVGGSTTAMSMGQFVSPMISQPISQNFGLGNTYIGVGAMMVVLALVVMGSGQLFRRYFS